MDLSLLRPACTRQTSARYTNSRTAIARLNLCGVSHLNARCPIAAISDWCLQHRPGGSIQRRSPNRDAPIAPVSTNTNQTKQICTQWWVQATKVDWRTRLKTRLFWSTCSGTLAGASRRAASLLPHYFRRYFEAPAPATHALSGRNSSELLPKIIAAHEEERLIQRCQGDGTCSPSDHYYPCY